MKENMNEAPLPILLHKVAHLAKCQAIPIFHQYDLKPGAAGILFTLDKSGSLSQRELADKVGITPPSMTVALRKMEEKGYISRKHDENDQRIFRIEIQEPGRRCAALVKQAMLQVEETLFKDFANEEKLLLRRLLLQMHSNLMQQNHWNEEEFKRVFTI